MKKSTATMIDGIRDYLKQENLYKAKDEMTLTLLGNTYEQYTAACAKVKKDGIVIERYDYNENTQQRVNPYLIMQLELQKQLNKLTDSLYLNPKSRMSIKNVKPTKKNKSQMDKMLTEFRTPLETI